MKPTPWEERLEKLGGGSASDRTKKSIHRFRRERRESRLPCLSLGDDRRGTSESRDASLAIFITFMSGSKGLTSLTNSFLNFVGPPGFRLAFDASKRNGRFGRTQCQRAAAAEKRDEFSSAERVKEKSQVIPTSFLKIKGGRSLGQKPRDRGTVSRIGK